jgi:hypothetical protein
MKTKRVLWVESGRLLGDVISSLVEENEHIALIRSAPPSSQALLAEVRAHRPHIVVLDDTLHAEFLRGLLRYMQRVEGLRVVVVDAESNCVEVYQKEQIRLRHSADFFAVL